MSGEITNYKITENIPPQIYKQLCDFCSQKSMEWGFPKEENVEEVQKNKLQGYINRNWLPQINVVGSDGIPSLEEAGNVLRPYTTYRLSYRIPPNFDS